MSNDFYVLWVKEKDYGSVVLFLLWVSLKFRGYVWMEQICKKWRSCAVSGM